MNTHKLAVLSNEAQEYAPLIPALLPDNVVLDCITTEPGDVDKENVTILLADPDLAALVIPQMPALKWFQSVWAGNRPLLALDRQDYLLTAAKGIFGVQMREYVFTWLLHYSRSVDDYAQAQRNAVWSPPGYARLQGKTLGITGAGSIADALLPVAEVFGLNVIGLSRSGKPKAGYTAMYTQASAHEFAGRCDFVLNLMPDTPDTRGLLNADFFSALPGECVLINAGRGSAIVEADLLSALDNGQLRAAVLDVFNEEPLPASHPFWQHPKIKITQHTAAESRPADVAALFADNLQRYLSRQPLMHQFDFTRGY
ncbi:MAG: D-2-hydroxyacid dehydrogenase [Pseudomonadota bacterium]|nr:D-2-hydroxyacid dehydrogenase [Pseudomonadota bacterium]